MLEVEETIQSQYAASPIINALISNINSEIDPRSDIKLLYDKYINPETAEGKGLDDWIRIVNLSRNINLETMSDFLGFTNTGYKPFDDGIFYMGKRLPAGVYSIEDGPLRELLMWKARVNIGAVSCADLNESLSQLFKGYGVVVREVGLMNIEIDIFTEQTPFQQFIFEQYKDLLVGAGVGVSIKRIYEHYLGFSEGYYSFAEGTFFDAEVVIESDMQNIEDE